MNADQMSQLLGETVNVEGELKMWNMYRARLALEVGDSTYDRQFSLIPASVTDFNRSNPNSYACRRKVEVFWSLFVSDCEFL